MNQPRVTTIARQAAGISRRGSLAALGGTALVALTAPAITNAGKAKKKSRKSRKVCKKQGTQCRQFYTDYCEGVQSCIEQFSPCCDHLARCNATAYLQCTYAIVV